MHLVLFVRRGQAIEDVKGPGYAREGGLLALASFCDRLGRLFEPYIIHILPLLIASFADNDRAVRMAAEDCSRSLMGNLSAQGVKVGFVEWKIEC